MPLTKSEEIATNRDGSPNEDYCIYCYKDGSFTQEVNMDEMIDISFGFMKEMHKDNPDFNEKEALENMKSFFPQLKRWKE